MATKISLKLLLNKNTNKVLFAEAGKDFVDFLIGLLALPLGTIIQLLNQKQMVGCLGKLHASLETLDTTYLQSGIDKDLFLNPRTSSPGPQNTLLLQGTASASSIKQYYRCSCDCVTDIYGTRCRCVTDIYGTRCPSSRQNMNSSVRFVAGTVDEGKAGGGSCGYVEGVVTYMVMDDLVVSPMSTISSITLLNKFQVKEVGALEERTVEIGMDEALELLKASLHSTTVLSDVLLEKNTILTHQLHSHPSIQTREKRAMATKISLKLLLNKNTNKVLFAKAGKDFVDFLIGLFALPLGTIIQLLNQKQMVGCLGKLHASLQTLNTTDLQSGIDKLQRTASASSIKQHSGCSNCLNCVTVIHGTRCSSCSRNIISSVRFVSGTVDEGKAGGGSCGYVKGVVTYMVMDDLVVSPSSTISSITLLNKFQVKEVGALEERTVEIGMDEALELLKASLHSTTVLSDVLLEKK